MVSSDGSGVLPDVELQSFLILKLTTIISQIDAFDYDPDDLEFVSFALFTKAMAFAAQFRITGELDDIDESISLLKIVAHFPDCKPSRVALSMSTSARLRYDCTNNAHDLDCLIDSEEALLQFEDLRSEPVFLQLARHLCVRSKDKIDVADAERISSLYEEVYPILSTDSDKYTWSAIKGMSISALSESGRMFSDVRQSLSHVEQSAMSETNSWSTRAPSRFLAQQLKYAALNGNFPQLIEIERIARGDSESTRWSIAYLTVFYKSTEDEVNKSIALLRAGYDAMDPDDACMRMYTLILATALFQRFVYFNKLQDLQDAIAFRKPFARDSVFLIDPMLLDVAANLHPGYQERSKTAVRSHLGDGDVSLASRSSHPTFSELSRKFYEVLHRKNGLASTSLHSSDIKDFDIFGIDNPDGQDTLAIRDFDHLSLMSQADRYRDRYQSSSQDQADLEQAISFLEIAVERLSPEDPHAAVFKLALARDLFTLHSNHPESVPLHKLRDAFDCFRVAANDQQVRIHVRREATKLWFFHLLSDPLWDEQKHHTRDMCNTWLSISREQNWLSSTSRATLSLQRKEADSHFLPEIVIVFMLSNYGIDSPEANVQAVEILELGRSFLWEQVQSLRKTLDVLSDVNPGLFSRFLDVSKALESAYSPQPRNFEDHSLRLHKERRQIIEEIRSIPGFQNAFRDEEFEIGSVCSAGPIVILLACEFGSLAIILVDSGSCVEVLPITLHRLKQLHDALRDLTNSRSLVSGEEAHFAADNNDGSPMVSTSCNRLGGLRAGRRRNDRSLSPVERILECLWDNVAKPVLDRVWKIRGITEEQARADRTPLVGFILVTR